MQHTDAGARRRQRQQAAVGLGIVGLTVGLAYVQRRNRGSAVAPRSQGVRVERVTTINRPVEVVYAFWKQFENLPRFMRHLESVTLLGERRSRWVAKGPAGMRVEWEAETVQDRENEWIAWRSLAGSTVRNSGSVRFERAPGGRGTELRVQLQYSPPGGALGRSVAWLFGEEPDQQVHEDLHRFKQIMEAGEVPLSDGPSLWRPARPAADPEDIRKLMGVRA